MTSFFRRIRHNLANTNQFLKYSRYAIGEILLVVVGILIALYINNWNENRKNKIEEYKYYCKILTDFDLDRQNIQALYKESENKIVVSKRLLIALHKKDKDKAYLLNNYLQALRTNVFVPSKATITDLISSGKLNLLSNDTIKSSLIRYYGDLDKFLYQLKINNSKSLERVFLYDDNIEFGTQNFDYVAESLGNEILRTLPQNDWHLDSQSKYFRQFQNDLVIFVTMSEREKQHFKGILNQMESTYKLLNEACDRN